MRYVLEKSENKTVLGCFCSFMNTITKACDVLSVYGMNYHGCFWIVYSLTG